MEFRRTRTLTPLKQEITELQYYNTELPCTDLKEIRFTRAQLSTLIRFLRCHRYNSSRVRFPFPHQIRFIWIQDGSQSGFWGL